MPTWTSSPVIQHHATSHDLQHFVRRVTVGPAETYGHVQRAIDILKGSAGLDENGIHLFKDDGAIDEVWAGQQKHLECLRDPPGFNMYIHVKSITRNGITLPYYNTMRGTTQLEGFHRFLPDIPGPRCAAVPFQVYPLSGIARWNADREAQSVKGQKGRKNKVYSSSLISRLNERCMRLFGEKEEENFCPPVPAGEEMIGLEYLFSQSSETFTPDDHYKTTVETLQTAEEGGCDDEVIQTSEETEDADKPEGEEENADDGGYTSDQDATITTPLTLQVTDTAAVAERDPCEEDVCGPCHLPGYQYVENLSDVLVNLALDMDNRLSFTAAERKDVVDAWNNLDLHDRNIKSFDKMYTSRWGHAYYGRSYGDPDEASIIQKLKFTKRHAAAHPVNPRKNRLVYCLLKKLWLNPSIRSKPSSPIKRHITALYQRLQQRVTVDDKELCKLGIPLVTINTKSVAEFIRKQEALAAKNATDQGDDILRRTHSISSASLPPAKELPDVRPESSRPQVTYPEHENLAGTRNLKRRRDFFMSAPQEFTLTSTGGP